MVGLEFNFILLIKFSSGQIRDDGMISENKKVGGN